MAASRIALFGASASDFAARFEPLVKGLARDDRTVACFAPDWPDALRREVEAEGDVRVSTFTTDLEGFHLFRNRALSKTVAEEISQWRADAAVVLGWMAAEMVGPALVRADVPRRLVLLDTLPRETAGRVAAKPGADPTTWDPGTFQTAICHCSDVSRHVARAIRTGGGASAPDVLTLTGFGADLAAYPVAELPVLKGGLRVLAIVPAAANQQDAVSLSEAIQLLKTEAPGVDVSVCSADCDAGAGTDALGTIAAFGGTAVGEGSLQDTREPDAQDDGQSETISEDRLAELIRNSHAVVCLRSAGGQPKELALALALGRPVIMQRTAGGRVAVDERVNGILADPSDSQDIAEAVKALARRPDLLPSMAAASRAKAERLFDRSQLMARHLEAIDEAGR